MQLNSVVILCDSDHARVERLQTILSFLGQDAIHADNAQLSAALSNNENVNHLVFFGGEIEELELLRRAYLHVPFVAITEQDVEINENVIGQLRAPFLYAPFTQLLHRCASFINHLPGKQTNLNNEGLRQSLIGKGIAIQEVRHLIEQVAGKDANVLILGESGTGKEVVAKAIHDNSRRSNGPFVPINCGAIPADLLESELFGHEKGAFTGAFTARKGRFELAEGGTLFLDEIGDMPMPMQVKLLRVLQERLFERVGGSKSIQANVRIIAATHRNLEQMIETEKFREDLYYRLNVFPIEMPALKERVDDIPLLLQELVGRHEHEHQAMVRFTQRAMESLMQHTWPGNVRELSNLVERLLILHPNQIVDVSDLPYRYQHVDADVFEPSYNKELEERAALLAIFSDDEEAVPFGDTTFEEAAFEEAAFAGAFESEDELSEEGFEEAVAPQVSNDLWGLPQQLPEEGLNLKEMLADLEVELIRQALEQQDGVVARAADQLGMRRTTLVEKMRKYGLTKQES